MAPERSAHVDEEAARVARRLFALSDPTRLAIVALVAGGERCVCELTEALGAAQSRLSFHLRTLKDAGVLSDERRGRWIYYRLEPGVLAEVADSLSAIERGEWGLDAEGCCGPSCCGG